MEKEIIKEKEEEPITRKDIEALDKTLDLTAVRSSSVADSKNIFKSEERQKAFNKRYGKDARITISYELNGKNLKELTQQFQSANNKVYSLTEYFTENQTTDYCLLCCRRNGKNYEYKFDRFLDAEVSLVDLIAEE